MRYIILYLLLFFKFCAVGQSLHNNNCIYTVEGMVSDGNSYDVIKYAIIKNDELGIAALSDDRGYYALSFPVKYLDSNKMLGFEVFKDGYKINKWWIMYNPMDLVLNDSSGKCHIWNYDLKMIKLQKLNTIKEFYVSAHRRKDTIDHGFVGIRTSFEEFVDESKRADQMEILKANNENVFFKLNGKYVICIDGSTIYLPNKKINVYINNKRIKLRNLNKLLKRSMIIENRESAHRYYSVHKNSKRNVFYLESK